MVQGKSGLVRLVDPKELVINLIRNGYDMASCGIGSQRYLVQALIDGAELNAYQRREYEADLGSNLLGSPFLLGVYEGADHFGPEASERIGSERRGLDQLNKKLYHALFRLLGTGVGEEVTASALAGHVYNAPDLTVPEVRAKLEALKAAALLEEGKTPVSDKTLEQMVSDTSIIYAMTDLMSNHRMFPTQFCLEELKRLQHSESLRPGYTQLHIGKLELMADIINSAVHLAAKSGYVVPRDFNMWNIEWTTSKLKEPTQEEINEWNGFWHKNFGEAESPNIYELMEQVQATISAARKKYPPIAVS